MQKPLVFQKFLNKFFPDYQIDEMNHSIVTKLSLWANRDSSFENASQSMWLDKGILISGPVGTGKTELMRLLRFYLGYLGSPYGYKSKIVWKFAEAYKEENFRCFRDEASGNCYYDELALTDEGTGKITRESVSHFGDKVLIGRELIMLRYNAFKANGYQTHFTTNLEPAKLVEIYGERVEDRLSEMCNFFVLDGRSRRGIMKPTFHRNVNDQRTSPSSSVTRNDEHENKVRLNEQYKKFCEGGLLGDLAMFDYTLLKIYGADVITDEGLSTLEEFVKKGRAEEILSTSTDYNVERRRKQLRNQYATNEVDDEERQHIWNIVRRTAISQFYFKMKESGKEKVFEDV